MASGKFTARGAAMARAAGACDPTVDGADTLAAAFLPFGMRAAFTWPLLRPLALAYYERIAPGIYPYHNARTRHFDALVVDAHRAGVPQLVILGAGLDSRAYRLPLHGMRVFEVDHPGTAAWKRERLDALRLARAHVAYASIDFDRERLDEVLPRAGWDAAQPSFFLWEGVTCYLTAEAIDATLAFVGRAAAGSQLAFDYVYASALTRPGDYFGAVEALRTVERTGEPYKFGVDPDGVAPLLARHGLQLVSSLRCDEAIRRWVPKTERRPPDYMALAHARR